MAVPKRKVSCARIADIIRALKLSIRKLNLVFGKPEEGKPFSGFFV